MMTAAKIFIYLCFAFLAGIGLASFLKMSLAVGFLILILGLSLIGILWNHPKPAAAGFCLIFFVLGVWRFQSFETAILRQGEDKNLSGQKAVLIGRVDFEPDKRPGYTNLKIKVEEAWLFGDEQKPLTQLAGATIWTTVKNYPEFFYNDRLRLLGKLQIPEAIDGFNWPGYLIKEGIVWQMSWPQAELSKREPPSAGWPWLYSHILFLKQKLEKPIYQDLPLREGSFLAGLIFGDRSLMPKEFKDEMSKTGLSHIAAVSGANVIILSSILMVLFIGLGLWRQQAFWLALIFLWVFIILVGLPASAVRAGAMASLLLSAQYLGRQNATWRAMILAGAAMLYSNPLLLRYDIGFQLSFLAVAGLVFLAPIVKEKMKFIPGRKFFNLKEILAQTLSAQIITLPILIYNFGYISLVAPLSNILIVPFIPLMMAMGFIFVLAGIFWPWLGWILSWPSSFLLIAAVKAIDICASLPLASLALKISWVWLAVFYILLLFWVIRWQRKHRFLESGYV
ncbi:MAG: ComEC/Rec2 family competence protein [Candidatus Paceibacterota bacterium]|jgi:competence protein ComEC